MKQELKLPASAINTRTNWHPMLRPIARLLVLAQLALVLQPLSVLAQPQGAAPYNPQAQAQLQRLGALNLSVEQAKAAKTQAQASPADKVSDSLQKAQELVAQLKGERGSGADAASRKAQRNTELRDHLSAINAGTASVRAEFAATRTELLSKNLPAEILARHDAAQAQFEQRAAQFNQISSQNSNDDDKVNALDAFFKQYPAGKRHIPLDPAKLPWGAPKATPRMPAETKTAWYQTLTKDHKVQLAQVGGSLTTIGGVQFNMPPEPGQAPSDADLSETADIQLTPAIRAKAAELGNNPVAIYNWVHNTIQHLPTWGSIQGAEGTLKTQRGNAFDTASLTIALLRASGIPARYQFGTIDLPAAQAMNWVGGVQKPEAALNLLYQGGIAARGLASGGQLTTIRMEHIWVNAYVNWMPSRGAKDGGANLTPKQHPNPNASLNAWVPLDASFKQYSYSAGMDLKTAVPLDANALITAVQQGASITPNYAQNLNQLKAYINSTPTGANSTVGDVLGTQTIKTSNTALLGGTLPYRMVVMGNERAELPDSLRWKITFKLFASDNDKANDTTLIAHRLLLSAVGNRRISASAIPATEADQNVIAQYVGGNAASLPLYLIHQKVQLKLDDLLLAETGAQRMGDTQWWNYVLEGPNFGPIEEDFKLEAAVGDSIVFGVDAYGMSFADVASRAQQVNPDTALENLHHLAIGYWSRTHESDKILANQSDVVVYRLPSVGLFSSPLTVQYSWGIPRLGHYSSYAIDVRRLSISAEGKNNSSGSLPYLKNVGIKNSFLEGRVLEEILDLAPGGGVSAISVIAVASQSGIALWQLNNSNLGDYLAVSTLSSDMQQNITNAVANGLEVIAPEDTVDVGKWHGGAYIAIDPLSGSGAYIIGGGANGGEFESCEIKVQPLVDAISQRILTQVAIRLALFLIAEAGLATASVLAPPAAPVLAQAMIMVGITFLTFSSTEAEAGSKCGKSSKDCHRGRFQAQGKDIRASSSTGGKSDTKSRAWNLPAAPTAAQGVGYLQELKSLLNPSELLERLTYFADMERFVLSRSAQGGICAPYPGRSEGPNPSNADHVRREIRVDLEVKAGSAFGQ